MAVYEPLVFEVKVLMAHEDYLDERLSDWQNVGWEIAGQIMLTKNTNGDGSTFIHIPMKREIKRETA